MYSIRTNYYKVSQQTWLAANKLSQNVGETKFMVFHSDKNKVVYPKLLVNNIKMECVDCFNFLGLQLNHNLNWNKHVCFSLSSK